MSIKRLSSRSSLLVIGMLLVVLILSIIVIKQEQQIRQQAQTQQTTTFTFVNNTDKTIWVGAHGNPGHIAPNNGGWELAAHATMDVSTPNNWAGLFWGRTGCNFDSQGNGTCETGDCGNGLYCNGARYKTVGGTSLAEFALNQYQGLDFYDVSLVDGYNIPVIINTVNSSQPDPITANGCIDRPAANGPSGCTSDVNAVCPQELQVKNSSGQVIACTSACIAFKTDQYCCTGAYGSTETCNHAAWPVDYAYNVFKPAQPFAYSYAFDDASSTFTCSHCNYRITFGLPSANDQPPLTPNVTLPPTVIPTFNCLGNTCPTLSLTPPSAPVSSVPSMQLMLSQSPVLSVPVTSIQPTSIQPSSPLPSITEPQPQNPNVGGFVKFILCYILPLLFKLIGIDPNSLGTDFNSICSNT